MHLKFMTTQQPHPHTKKKTETASGISILSPVEPLPALQSCCVLECAVVPCGQSSNSIPFGIAPIPPESHAAFGQNLKIVFVTPGRRFSRTRNPSTRLARECCGHRSSVPRHTDDLLEFSACFGSNLPPLQLNLARTFFPF